MFLQVFPLVLLLLVRFARSTAVHAPGTCAIYESCGKKSLFGQELPCPANVAAKVPETEKQRSLLAEVCGASFADGPVCCSYDQVVTLQTNLKKAEGLIASCPACRDNFYQLFCRFTCSPDQSQFVNVTKTGTSTTGKDIVLELDTYVNETWARAFYDSCKNVKFSATNGYAMDLIGGGAKNYKEFLKFLGDEKPMLGGSPFQINYLWPEESQLPLDIVPSNGNAKDCSDPDFRCSCADCPDSCPSLQPVAGEKQCTVAGMKCFSFAVLFIYSAVPGLYVLYRLAEYFFYKYKDRQVQLFQPGESEVINDEFSYRSFSNDSSSLLSRNLIHTKEVYIINGYLEKWFGKLAFYCAFYPKFVIFTALLVTGILSGCALFVELEKNPINLWVPSSAEAFKQKQYFDDKFGPFYRTQQIFLSNDTGNILNYETVQWWFDKEAEMLDIQLDNGIRFDDLCFKPTDTACVVESFTQYFHGDSSMLDETNWEKQLSNCANTPVNCLPEFQQPLKKELLFGGYSESDVLTSQAIVVTLLLENSNNDTSEQLVFADQWEHKLEKFLLNLTEEAASRGLRMSFNTEISLEKELNKSTSKDIKIIVFSYILMFIYASLALSNKIPSIHDPYSFINTKISIGLAGIFIVLLSVSSSVGIFALLGVKSTLIIAEVIPFLVLAVGVDNIFLITHELQHINASYPNESIPERISSTIGRIAPSIVLSSTTQCLTFSLGTFVEMPAVRNFALYSSVAVFFNALLQLTVLISLFSLDQKRIEQNRLDVWPFKKLGFSNGLSNSEYDAAGSNSERPHIAILNEEEVQESVFTKVLKKYYAPFILNSNVKPFLLAFFVLWLGISLISIPDIELGLDQRVAIPTDSYLIDYFNDLYAFFNVGAPIYFVIKSLDVTSRANQRKLCGRFTTCNEYSLTNIVEQERKRSEISTIIEPAASWIDDFFLWLSPDLDQCCRFRKNTNKTVVCPPFASPRLCETCYDQGEWDSSMENFPEHEDFIKFFDIWIESPSIPCPLGGKAPYGNAVYKNPETGVIESSTFRTSHIPLRSQEDFIKGYEQSLRVSKEIEDKFEDDEVEVFAYSPFYIFFVQYQTIVSLTFTLVGSAMIIIFVTSSFLLGSLRTSLILCVTVLSTLINIGGMMKFWGISLNAVSLVNLVIIVGLAVEFCVHIARAFTVVDRFEYRDNKTMGSRLQRSFNSLTKVGGSVFGGIILTKFIGVCVLAFASSKIFQIYYFRMWFSLILIGSFHCLMLLPILLSYWGGRYYIYSLKASVVSDDLASRLRFSEIASEE